MSRFALVASVVLGLAAASANASLKTVFNNETPAGSNSDFNYSATIGTDESLDASQNSGLTPAGNFFTIYDIPGFVSATAPTGWTETSQLLGLTPENTSPADSATLTNVTFTYAPSAGASPAIITGPATIPGFVVVSSVSTTNTKGNYSSQDADGDGDVQAVGHVTIPGAVPEPGSLGLLAGSAMLMLRRRAKRAV